MDPYDFRERENVNYKEKSSSPEAVKSVAYNPPEKFDCFHPSVDLSSSSSTSDSTVSNVSVGYEPKEQHVCSNPGFHSYSKVTYHSPPGSRNKVAKNYAHNTAPVNRGNSQTHSQTISKPIAQCIPAKQIEESKTKSVPKPSQSQQPVSIQKEFRFSAKINNKINLFCETETR